MLPDSQRWGRLTQAAPAGPLPAGPPTGDPPAAGPKYGWPAVASVGLVAGVNLLAVTGVPLPFLGPAAGFWFLVVYPVYLLSTTSVWRGCSVAERLGYSLATALLLLMLAGLGVNSFLPLLGVQRPLDPIPAPNAP